MHRPIAVVASAAAVVGALATATAAMAQAQSPQISRAEMRTIAQACKADVQTLCAGVERGDGRIGQCLKDNAAQVSTPCKQALTEVLAK
ncbi:cysteine rich repeat-containing protein [Amorphus coralli]|uniref:cysteine rich repeat-containing protein n=1 Tax=Amorphus coralli TaxID=340680 RepID=UPI0003649130|nr:cysteine rich repeat-containing protein [Amorphus coralli]